MTTIQECASHLSGKNLELNGEHHNHLVTGAIEAFQKDLADIQKGDNQYHTQEHSASVAATNALIDANMLPKLCVDRHQAVFVAGATADKHDLVLSLGDPDRNKGSQMAVVMDAEGVYWRAKKDAQGHYVKDEHQRIGDEGQFENFAKYRLGQSDTLGNPNQQAPGPEAPAPQPPRPEAPASQPPRPEAPNPQANDSRPRGEQSVDAVGKFEDGLEKIRSAGGPTKDDLNNLRLLYLNMGPRDRAGALQEVAYYNSRGLFGSFTLGIEDTQNRPGGHIVISAERPNSWGWAKPVTVRSDDH